MNHSCSLNY